MIVDLSPKSLIPFNMSEMEPPGLRMSPTLPLTSASNKLKLIFTKGILKVNYHTYRTPLI